jgi:hypothetical protein
MDQPLSAKIRSRACLGGTLLLGMLAKLASGCAVAPQSAAAAAPTYEELFSTYFDQGTPGHCATAGCHADPSHNVWLCMDKDTCYQGMQDIGLIDALDPTHSQIADPKRSPLTWFNAAGGNMPLDAQGDNPSARAAIEEWVAAGAENN